MPTKKRKVTERTPFFSRTKALDIILCVLLLITLTSTFTYRMMFIDATSSLHTYTDIDRKIGEFAIDDRFAVSMSAVRVSSVQVPGMWELPEGQQFVLITLSFQNRSSSVYQLSPILQMALVDLEGTSYEVSSAPDIKQSLGGPIQAGETVSGEVGFMVPTSAKELSLRFDPKLPDAPTFKVKFQL